MNNDQVIAIITALDGVKSGQVDPMLFPAIDYALFVEALQIAYLTGQRRATLDLKEQTRIYGHNIDQVLFRPRH